MIGMAVMVILGVWLQSGCYGGLQYCSVLGGCKAVNGC